MHILQKTAKTSEIKEIQSPGGGYYNFEAGVWIGGDGLIAYDSQNQIVSKKNDIETGEDQKGQ
jgi:hypothetical protein